MTVTLPTAAPPGAFLATARLALRGVTAADADGPYREWMSDPEILRYLEARFRPTTPEGLRAFVAEQSARADTLFLAIALRDGGRHIGNIKLGPIDWHHRRGDIGIIVGARDCWGRGYATEAITAVTAHAFRTLNLHKVTAGAYAPNVGSVRAFERAGFVVEGVRRAHAFLDGAYVDVVEMGKVRGDA